MNHFIKGIIDSLVELLYPNKCISCDKVLLKIEKEVGFCKACAKKIKLVGPHYCLKCGVPVDNNEEYCKSCNSTSNFFVQNKAIFRYTGEMKNAMYRFKYANRRCYGKVFAYHAIKNYGSWIKEKGFDAIVPVPMYDKKEKKRGYNQAKVFADALSEVTNIPVADGIVGRKADTVAMKQLNRLKRTKNLLKAFTMVKNDVQFRKVLIVDDIYTTGSTLNEVSRVLKDGGVKEVYGLCICIGQL